MKMTLPFFERAKVLVVGDLMLDRYWYGSTNRISPEAPVPIVKVDTNSIEERPGGAANVAMNIAALGASCYVIGLTGVDLAANILKEKLKQAKVVCQCIELPHHPTNTKLRVISRHQQLIRLDFEEGDSFTEFDPQPLLICVKERLPEISVLVLSDYAKGALNNVQELIQLARMNNIPVLVDPKGRDFERYRGATLLTPNLSEFETLVGHCSNEDELVTRGMQLMASFELTALLVTRSEKGMTLLQCNKQPLHFPTQAKDVFDVTGAGDTVIGVLAAALAAGDTLEESCFLANAAAGVVVGKLGTSTVSPIELERVIHGESNTGYGVVTEQQLQLAIQAARRGGEKIIMTNGCFDILHAGHVSYLANARKLGDRLIVAVNDDASVGRLKGKNRPINPLNQRMQVLAALEAVDWVVPFSEDTPARLIAEILPDVLVKGGDYQLQDVAGRKEVQAAGGEVKILNFEEGLSTSKLISKIQNSLE